MEQQTTTSPQRQYQLRRALTFCVIAVVIAVVLTLVKQSPGELAVYLRAAGRFSAGEEIYRPTDLGPFTYPPFFVLPPLPLAILPGFMARVAFYCCNFVLLAGIIGLLMRQMRPVMPRSGMLGTERVSGAAPLIAERIPRFRIFLAIVLVLSARHVVSPVEYQGHDLIVFLLVMLTVVSWDNPQQWWPGFWAGLGAACKATPLLFLAVFLWQRRFRTACSMVVTLSVATLLPDMISPRADGELWVSAWHKQFVSKVHIGESAHAQGAWKSWNYINQSLSGTLYRLSTHVPEDASDESIFNVSVFRLNPHGTRVLTIVAQLLVVGCVAFFTRPSLSQDMPEDERRFHRLGEGAVVMCAMLLLSPMTSKQHFCLLLVPIVFCVSDQVYRRRSLVVAIMMGTVFLLGTVAAKDFIGRPLGNRLLAYGSLTLCTMCCLLATGSVLLHRSRTHRRAIQLYRQALRLAQSEETHKRSTQLADQRLVGSRRSADSNSTEGSREAVNTSD